MALESLFRLPEFHNAIWTLLFAVVLLSIKVFSGGASKNSDSQNHPYGRWYLEYVPRWISGTLDSRNALKILEATRKKYPDSAFKLVRLDTDITILPDSTIEELAGLPNEVASNILALQYDLVGQYTGLSMLQDVDLHLKVVQRRMMPNMAQLTQDLEEEVSAAIKSLFPKQEGGLD